MPTSSAFTLTALLDQSKLCGDLTSANYDFFIAAAITPPQAGSTPTPDFGSFTIDGDIIYFRDMEYGTPPVAASEGDLGPHGVYETWYYEFDVPFIC